MKNTISKRSLDNERLSMKELNEWMKKEGISEKELAEILGVTLPAVRFWTSGQREFTVTNSRLVRMFQKYPNLIREF